MPSQIADEKMASVPRWRNSGQPDAVKKNNAPVIEKRFVTVAIPDVRQQVDFLAGGEAIIRTDSAAASAPVNTTENNWPSSSLRAIKSAIERKFVGTDSPEFSQSIEALVAAIPEPVVEKNENESDEVTPENQPVTKSKKKRTARVSPENCALEKYSANDSQYQPICNSIVERTPGCGAKIVTFASSEENKQLAEMVMKTAIAIESKTHERVLIVDSDFDDQLLSIEMDCNGQGGMSDIGKGGNTIEQLITATSNQNIDFLSVGSKVVTDTSQLAVLIRKALIEIGNDYEYIFVSLGEAHSHVTMSWADYTNGTFLLVDMATSNREIAKSAVSQLNSFGARLVGCIVSTVDE